MTVDTTVNGSGGVTVVAINNPGTGYAIGDSKFLRGDATWVVPTDTQLGVATTTVLGGIELGQCYGFT